jgi:hypothetical protein
LLIQTPNEQATGMNSLRRDYKVRRGIDVGREDKLRAQLLMRQKTARRDLQTMARRLASGDVGGGDNNDAPSTSTTTTAATTTPFQTLASPFAAAASAASPFASATQQQSASNQGMHDDAAAATSTRTAATPAQRRAAKERRRKAVELHWSRQLMTPSWLVGVPSRLSQDWLVRPRPEGRRVVVVSSGGRTVARRRNGTVLHSFASALPDGSAATRCHNGVCVLDAIFDAAADGGGGVFFVVDVMCWVRLPRAAND